MNETVWFLSAVINGRFSVTSIMSDNTNRAVRDAEDYLVHTALVPLDDINAKVIQGDPDDFSTATAFSFISSCFVASLIKS